MYDDIIDVQTDEPTVYYIIIQDASLIVFNLVSATLCNGIIGTKNIRRQKTLKGLNSEQK